MGLGLAVVVLGLLIRRRLHLFAGDLKAAAVTYADTAISRATPGVQQVAITLRGTTVAQRLDELAIDRTAPGVADLRVDGFVRAPDRDTLAVWIPEPPVILQPGATLTLTHRFSGTPPPMTVRLHLTPPMRAGGSLVSLGYRIPLLDQETLDLANLRAILTSRARVLGVPGNTLPEWADLRAREETLANRASRTGDAQD